MFEEEKVDLKPEEETPEDEGIENKELEEEPETPKEGEEENPENSENTEEIDYEAETDKDKRLRKAESSAQYHREKNKELKENFVTKDELKEFEANITRKTFRSQIESEVERVARNPKEAKAILYHYDNSLVPTGDVQKDILRARLLANESRIEKENEELLAANQSKENRSKNISSGKRMEDESKEPSLDADTKNLIRMNKMTWDSKLKMFRNENKRRTITYNPATDEVKTTPK